MDKITRIREEIDAGTYLTEDKIDVVISKVSAELGIDNPGVDEQTAG